MAGVKGKPKKTAKIPQVIISPLAEDLARKDLKPSTKLVYICLSSRVGKDTDRGAWPKPDSIAKDMGLGRSTVFEALEELQEAGLIVNLGPWRKGSRTNKYQVHAMAVWIEVKDESPDTGLADPDTGL